MRRKRSTTALCFLLAGASAVTGQSVSSPMPDQTPPPMDPIVLDPIPKTKGHRPKAPSLQQITCTYDGEALNFEFVIPEGECTMTLSGDLTMTYAFDSSELNAEVYVGTLHSDTEITLTTEYGNEYSGTLEF